MSAIDYYDLCVSDEKTKRYAYETEAIGGALQAQARLTLTHQPQTIAIKHARFRKENGKRLYAETVWLRTYDGQRWTDHAPAPRRVVRHKKEPLPDWVQQPGLKTATDW